MNCGSHPAWRCPQSLHWAVCSRGPPLTRTQEPWPGCRRRRPAAVGEAAALVTRGWAVSSTGTGPTSLQPVLSDPSTARPLPGQGRRPWLPAASLECPSPPCTRPAASPSAASGNPCPHSRPESADPARVCRPELALFLRRVHSARGLRTGVGRGQAGLSVSTGPGVPGRTGPSSSDRRATFLQDKAFKVGGTGTGSAHHSSPDGAGVTSAWLFW